MLLEQLLGAPQERGQSAKCQGSVNTIPAGSPSWKEVHSQPVTFGFLVPVLFLVELRGYDTKKANLCLEAE